MEARMKSEFSYDLKLECDGRVVWSSGGKFPHRVGGLNDMQTLDRVIELIDNRASKSEETTDSGEAPTDNPTHETIALLDEIASQYLEHGYVTDELCEQVVTLARQPHA
jgi:hypothetical protein